MKIKILWSWWSMPTPRVGSNSEISNLARKYWYPYKRNSSCLGIPDIKTIFDCPEDISDSLNNAWMIDVDNIFITHWHPDHSFWLRLILNSVFDPVLSIINKKINLYMPQIVYDNLKQHYPAILFYVEEKHFGNINFLEHAQSIEINDYIITTIWYEWSNSSINWYLIEKDDKKVLYTPCETIQFQQFDLSNIDVLITECGIFSYDKVKSEISFPNMIKNIKQLSPKKTYITHIEEIEVHKRWVDYLEYMKKKYNDVNFEFAYDNMTIKL